MKTWRNKMTLLHFKWQCSLFSLFWLVPFRLQKLLIYLSLRICLSVFVRFIPVSQLLPCLIWSAWQFLSVNLSLLPLPADFAWLIAWPSVCWPVFGWLNSFFDFEFCWSYVSKVRSLCVGVMHLSPVNRAWYTEKKKTFSQSQTLPEKSI